MKLIDLLVQELPKRGGWPKGARVVSMHANGDIYINGCRAPKDFTLPQCSDGWYAADGGWDIDNSVTRGQYEAAIAASQKPVWDGEGLPPVGTECERSWCGDNWLSCKIVAVTDEFFVVKLSTREACYGAGEVKFRPIRSEVDRKRDETISALIHAGSKETDKSLMDAVYDAIASGKIPHVKLETN